jgi:hypothetical protein
MTLLVVFIEFNFANKTSDYCHHIADVFEFVRTEWPRDRIHTPEPESIPVEHNRSGSAPGYSSQQIFVAPQQLSYVFSRG